MSGVKVTNQRPARPIPTGESVGGSVDDQDVDWTPDTTTGIPPGTDPGDVLTWDGDSWEPEPPSAGDFELKNEGGQDYIHAHGSMGSTETFDPTDGNVHTGTLNANCTFTLSAPVGTGFCSLELWLTEDGTGGWDVIWPGSVTEVGTHDTTLATTQRVNVSSVDGGTSWLATWIGSEGSTADAELNIEGGQSVIDVHGSMGSTETFDPTDGNVHTGTLDADCTFTLNVPTGTGACLLELRLTQDGTGGWVITWPGSVTVIGTLDTTASTSSIVILETLDGGTSWVAVVVGAGSGGSAIEVDDDGTPLTTALESLDFVGSPVDATAVGDAVTVTIRSNEPVTDNPGTGPDLVWEGDDLVMEWVS